MLLSSQRLKLIPWFQGAGAVGPVRQDLGDGEIRAHRAPPSEARDASAHRAAKHLREGCITVLGGCNNIRSAAPRPVRNVAAKHELHHIPSGAEPFSLQTAGRSSKMMQPREKLHRRSGSCVISAQAAT